VVRRKRAGQDVEGRRDIGLDMLEKGEELLVAMSCATLREDSAIGDIEGCEQGRRACRM
jgi:hypothetical protein